MQHINVLYKHGRTHTGSEVLARPRPPSLSLLFWFYAYIGYIASGNSTMVAVMVLIRINTERILLELYSAGELDTESLFNSRSVVWVTWPYLNQTG
jgi:hypothetical protein